MEIACGNSQCVGAEPIQAWARLPLTQSCIIQLCRQGESWAWEELVRSHQDRILNLAYQFAGNREEARDLAQEIFVRLYLQLDRYESGRPFRVWFNSLARNLCIDRIRARKPADPIDAMELPDDGGGPSGALQETQVARLVDAAVAGLPERQRLAVALVHFQEFSNIEAAEIMDVSVEALESLLARGRRALRGSLEGLRADLLGEP